MSKSYDIGKKSDMDRFMRDLAQAGRSLAVDEINARKYDVECPHCKGAIAIAPGLRKCPICSNEINFKLDIDFQS